MQRSADKRETLLYLQSMLRELAVMAKSVHQPMAAYLIEMAYVEVSDQLRGVGVAVHDKEAAVS